MAPTSPQPSLEDGDLLYSQLLDTAPDAMVVVGPDGTIRFVNVRTENLFGYARHELLGQHDLGETRRPEREHDQQREAHERGVAAPEALAHQLGAAAPEGERRQRERRQHQHEQRSVEHARPPGRHGAGVSTRRSGRGGAGAP